MNKTLPATYRHPLPGGLYYDLVRVQAGHFLMGSHEDAASGDETPHWVHIAQDYYMGKYPVTQEIWKALMDGHNPSKFKGDQRPVEQVSWQDIVEGQQADGPEIPFLTRINSEKAALPPALSDFQFWLPTEAEWEYAAKGGHLKSCEKPDAALKTTDIYTAYAGSDQLEEVAWYNLNSHDETKEIAKKQANELGLFDMCGNVWEWCQDWFDAKYYENCRKEGIVVNPRGPSEGHSRVYRGGSWIDYPRYCRVAYRSGWRPAFRDHGIGFRLVLSPSSGSGSGETK